MRDMMISALLALSPADTVPAQMAFVAPVTVLAHDGEVNSQNCHPGRTRGRMHCHPGEQITSLDTE